MREEARKQDSPLTCALRGVVEDPVLPLLLLVLAVQIAITTGTCVAEALSWEGFSGPERKALMGLYLPYLGFGEFFRALLLLRSSLRLYSGAL